MRHRIKVILSALLVACLCVIPTFSECMAAQPYTYTIKVLSGDQGSFNGKESLTYSGLKYGSVIDLSNAISSVNLSSDKYYVKGIRLSGHDNSELSNPAVTVSKDATYVIAYGIKGNMVSYTVNFQDASGKALATSIKGVGQIGDKPVVAYKYIEGYSPNAYNLTRTLTADESANVFTFVYSKVEQSQGTTVIVYNDTPTNNNNGTNTNTNNTTDNTEAAEATENDNNNQATGADELEEPIVQAEVTEPSTETDSTGVQEPEEIIDLDDPDVALAEAPITDDSENGKESKSLFLPLLIGGVVLLVLAALLISYIKNKRELDRQREE